MKWGDVFAWGVVTLQFSAGVGYLIQGEVKRSVLWTALALANTMLILIPSR